MRPVDDDGNGESEDEDTDEGAEPPDQLNIQDDQAGHGADYGFDDGVYVADKADNQMS